MKSRHVLLLVCLSWGSAGLYGRTWKDVQGRPLEADFVAMDGQQVVIRLAKGGMEIRVPLERLSAPDQSFLASQTASGSAKTPPSSRGGVVLSAS